MGSLDDSKDQMAADSSIPLSPQWLYSKPSEPKMDPRAPNSVSSGNSTESNLKEGWRLEGSEDKKDWRKIAPESDSSRRWREEERETSLLSGRRDRRKADRRVDNVSVRETIENRALPPADRWHDGNNRTSGHETRRDSKWSTRWGPEDKEKESRIEKRTDVEKEDPHNENQPGVVNNRPATDRDSESRDKWRPQHRMGVHSAGQASYRAAPGFVLEKGWMKGSTVGFTVGRGRSTAFGRASTGSSIGSAHFDKIESVPGKPILSTDTFCYPRGKLLDIYRRQKFDSSFASMPDYLVEVPPIAQVGVLEPLAFGAPNAEEDAILKDIWEGKITSSGLVYNSFRKGRSNENVTVGDKFESSCTINRVVETCGCSCYNGFSFTYCHQFSTCGIKKWDNQKEGQIFKSCFWIEYILVEGWPRFTSSFQLESSALPPTSKSCPTSWVYKDTRYILS